MTIEQAIKNNPYDASKGSISAYIRYLRYNVDGLYNVKSSDVRKMLKQLKEQI